MTLQGLINQAYPSPEWVVFFEVSNGTGWHAKRHADAVALGVWPSRGNTIVGFEFKEHRSDWLREKKAPAKAEVVAAHCDCWWVVAGAEDIVKVEELPEPWGLVVANKDRTRLLTKKQCQPFPDRDKSIMRRSFVAAMLRKVGETTVPKVELDRLVVSAVETRLAQSRDGFELKSLRERVAHLEGICDTFQTITGLNMRDWRGPDKIAGAVRMLMDGMDRRGDLEYAATRLEDSAKTLRTAIKEWPTL